MIGLTAMPETRSVVAAPRPHFCDVGVYSVGRSSVRTQKADGSLLERYNNGIRDCSGKDPKRTLIMLFHEWDNRGVITR